MYTSEALADIHERTHRAFAALLAHCGGFAAGDLDRRLDGFGYPTIRLQVHHAIGAERYWMGVVEGHVDPEREMSEFPTFDALGAFRAEVAAATRAWIGRASPAELDTPRPMRTWDGRERLLVPARIVLRTQTHVFQHQGQIVAMCRLLGRPASGMDFPLDPA